MSLCGCVSVCLSVKSHLTSGASVRPENTVRYPAGNGGQNICGVFFETAPFKSYGVKPVFLFDVQRSTSSYCMREYKHAYCSDQSYSASSSVQSQFQPLQHSRTRVICFRDSCTHGRRGFCTLVHSLVVVVK